MKRLAIIRALLKDSQYLILDELDAGLDLHNINIIKNIFSNLNREKTVIIITHNNIFDAISDEIIYLT